jgi:hypothetical protein
VKFIGRGDATWRRAIEAEALTRRDAASAATPDPRRRAAAVN